MLKTGILGAWFFKGSRNIYDEKKNTDIAGHVFVHYNIFRESMMEFVSKLKGDPFSI